MNGGRKRTNGRTRKPTADALGKRVETGRRGEDAAALHLQAHGYEIRHRNWRCRFGELDIAAVKDGVLVIVEVRTRRVASRFGTAAESVDARKRRQLQGVAQAYMAANGLGEGAVRFDVIACSYADPNGPFELAHIVGAF